MTMSPAERETYRLHAKLPVHKRRIDSAMRLVLDAMASVPGNWGVGVSGGKDSVVLSHLCVEAGWRGRLFHFRFEETPLENTALVYALSARWNIEVVDVLVPGDFTTFDRVGYFFVIPATERERRAVRAGEKTYKTAVERAARDAGFDGLFWGMRAEESRARAITLRTHGYLYRAASRETWTACPIADWTGRDVWAAIVANDLPYLASYDTSAQGRERERSETTWLGFDVLWRHGQGRRLRERDPALWARLVQRWPGLRDRKGWSVNYIFSASR